MCSSGEVYTEIGPEVKTRRVKKSGEKLFHLYKEKVFHVSKRNSQTLTTGYRPNENGRFKFCIRLDDYRFGDSLKLTLFQFVNLLKDLRHFIYDEDEAKVLDKVDASLQFSFMDINVPKVLVEIDPSYTEPDIFQLKLADSKNEQVSKIIFDRASLQRIIEAECDIINTIEALEDRPSNHLFEAFITKCVDHLQDQKTEINSAAILVEIKSIYKTPFQSEVFLKFWALICKMIEDRLKACAAKKCETAV